MINSQTTETAEPLELTVGDILQSVRRLKFWLLGIIVITTILGLLVATMMRPVYRASIVLSPAELTKGSDKFGGIGGQLGGLAALAGVGPTDSSKFEEAMAILQSRQFARKFIETNNLLPVLFAGIWDAETETWMVDDPVDVPTIQDGIYFLINTIRSVVEDKNTGLINVHVEWFDPELSAEWANGMVAMANRYLRDRAIGNAEKSISYLSEELERTTSIEVRAAIYSLMESQIQNIMYANVLDDYAFSVIDPAIAPEADNYMRPNRPLIVVLSFFAGSILALLFASIAAYRASTRDT